MTTSGVSVTTSDGNSPQLRRALGPGMAMAMVVGNVIGSGIFMKPAEVAAAAGSFPLIITAWVAGGVICFLGALCFCELAVMLPRAGGIYVYLKEAYAPSVGFLFGWSEFVFGRPASIGALAVGVVDQIERMAGLHLAPVFEVALALLLIVLFAGINIRGALWGGHTQAATTLIKSTALGLLAALPFFLMAGGADGIQVSNFQTTIEPASRSLSTQFAVALLAIMWAYNGWHGITPVAEEVRDPNRNIPLALFGGLTVLVTLYLAANIAYHGVLEMHEVRDAGTTLPQTMVEKLLKRYGSGFASAGVAILSLGIMVSLVGAINTNLMNGPRIAFAMGRDRVFFSRLGSVHAVFQTPATAIVVQAVMAAILVIASSLLVNLHSTFADKNIYGILSDFVVFTASLFYMLAVGAVVILRIRQPDKERPYRTPLYPAIPLLYLAVNVWFLCNLYLDSTTRFQAHVGVGLTLLGLPLYFVLKRRRERQVVG